MTLNDNSKDKAETDILKKLLAKVTKENKHNEIVFCSCISKEIKQSNVNVMIIDGMPYKIVGRRRPAKYRSELFAIAHKTAVVFYKSGLIDAKLMDQYDDSCLGIEYRKMHKKTTDRYRDKRAL